jgi:hypothetical protein
MFRIMTGAAVLEMNSRRRVNSDVSLPHVMKVHKQFRRRTKSFQANRPLRKAIQKANEILPGQKRPEGETDPRWQAVIAVSLFSDSDPEEVWDFAYQWGQSSDEDLRSAIATCILEHLLGNHFDLIFPRVERAVKSSPEFADTFRRIWKFDQACEPANEKRVDRLMSECNPAS